MLQVLNLTKTYKLKEKQILANKNISLQVENGKMVGIFGKSGSGKSTFLNQLAGLDVPDFGSIIWDNIYIEKYSFSQSALFRRNYCGIVFQFFELIKAQTAYDNAALPLKLLKKTPKEIEAVLFPLFEEFDSKEFIKTKTAFLSGGEMQRVALIRALSTKPKYIIADEITASLDECLSNHVYGYLRNYIKQNAGIGIFVSHDKLLEKYIDEKFTMEEGKMTNA